MDLGLKGKAAIVTGGARGLGRAICQSLASEGAHIVVNYCSDSSEAAIEELTNLLRGTGVDAIGVQADVGLEAGVAKLFDVATKRIGPVDVLVNNAAVCPTCPVHEMTWDVWDSTVRTNLGGVFLTCREFVRRLRESERHGRIVNVSSTSAFLGSTSGHAPYDASKGGLNSFTVSLAREVAPLGIGVNAVAPGMIRTEMTAGALAKNEAKYLARIPVNRIANPEEIADVVVFLASKRASYMTGATVNVSGGLLMR